MKFEQFHATEHGTGKSHDGSILTNVGGTNQPLRMLVDTGAQISVLKQNLIPNNIPINIDTQYEIAGITIGSIKTLGRVELAFHDRSYRF